MSTSYSRQNTNQAGAFLVAAEFCRLGFAASPESARLIDIVVSGPDGSNFAVQVKAKRTGDWQLDARSFLDIERNGKRQVVRGLQVPPHPDLLCVFVLLGKDYGTDEFFVLSWKHLQQIVSTDYDAFLSKHRGIRPRNSDSFHTRVTRTQLASYRNNWSSAPMPSE